MRGGIHWVEEQLQRGSRMGRSVFVSLLMVREVTLESRVSLVDSEGTRNRAGASTEPSTVTPLATRLSTNDTSLM